MKNTFVTLFFIAILASTAHADSYNFTYIDDNNNPDPSNVIGQQMTVDVISDGASGTFFTFRNNVGIASSIADIYFDFLNNNPNPVYSGLISSSSLGVSFSVGANPSNLPAGNNIGFTANFSTDSDAPVPHNGINANTEFLRVQFTDLSLGTAIANLNDGTYRVGLHVQTIPNSSGSLTESEGYVNIPTNPIPEPTTMLLFGTGLIGLTGVIRKKRK